VGIVMHKIVRGDGKDDARLEHPSVEDRQALLRRSLGQPRPVDLETADSQRGSARFTRVNPVRGDGGDRRVPEDRGGGP
jgi:hypothetical protein